MRQINRKSGRLDLTRLALAVIMPPLLVFAAAPVLAESADAISGSSSRHWQLRWWGARQRIESIVLLLADAGRRAAIATSSRQARQLSRVRAAVARSRRPWFRHCSGPGSA